MSYLLDEAIQELKNVNEVYMGRAYKYVDRKTGDIYRKGIDGNYVKVGNVFDKPTKPDDGGDGPKPPKGPQPNVNQINPPQRPQNNKQNKNQNNQQNKNQNGQQDQNDPDDIDDQNPFDNQQGDGNGMDGKSRKMISGKLIDDHTFEDDFGNIIRI